MSDEQERELKAELIDAFDATERGELTLGVLQMIVFNAVFAKPLSEEGQRWGMRKIRELGLDSTDPALDPGGEM